MFNSRRFLYGFALSVFLVATPLFGLQLILLKAGELDIDNVIAMQASHEKVLYSSGLNQSSYYYKLKLFDFANPDVIAIGSSRAMQVRGAFFKPSFVNLGGSVNGITELESLVSNLASRKNKPRIAFVFLDPWWFIQEYARDGGPPPVERSANRISISIARYAISSLREGNWISKLSSTDNLGIHAILTNEGFGQDGSFHYTSTLTGNRKSGDAAFFSTLDRVRLGKGRFGKAENPDPRLLSRACTSIKKLRQSIDHIVVITPPFAAVVWNAMTRGGYQYITETNAYLAECLGASAFHNYISGDMIPNGTDCEFIDGLHGGDVTYARIMNEISKTDSQVLESIDRDFIINFIKGKSGFAEGVKQQKSTSEPEVDFLNLGCKKSS